MTATDAPEAMKLPTPTAINWLPVLAICLLSVAATSQLTNFASWPQTHDGLRYLYLIDHFEDGLTHGNLYPRFLPNACGGYGYPTFVFYPPAFFWLASPVAWLTGSPLAGAAAAVVGTFFIGGMGAYCVSSRMGVHAPIGLACAVLYMLTPYAYVNLYVRGDLTELLAMFLLPWPIYFYLDSAAKTVWGLRRVFLACSIALVIYAHPLTAMFYLPLLFGMMVIGSSEVQQSRLGDCCALAAGVAIASPYWLPVLLLQNQVAQQAAFEDYFQVTNHFVCWPQFFSPSWGFGYSTLDCNDEMSFQLGLPHAALVLTAVLTNLRRPRVVSISLLYLGLLILMMSPISALIWTTVPLIGKVQFAWRLLGVAAVCQLVLICHLGVWLSKHDSMVRTVMIPIVVVNCIGWYWPMFFPSPEVYARADLATALHRQNWLNTQHTYAAVNEFTPLTALRILSAEPLNDRPMTECDPECLVEYPTAQTRHAVNAVITTNGPTTLVINQIYFPGWTVKINENVVQDLELATQLTADGRIQLPLNQPGTYRVQARFASPPGQVVGIAFAIIAFLVLCVAEMRPIFLGWFRRYRS